MDSSDPIDENDKNDKKGYYPIWVYSIITTAIVVIPSAGFSIWHIMSRNKKENPPKIDVVKEMQKHTRKEESNRFKRLLTSSDYDEKNTPIWTDSDEYTYMDVDTEGDVILTGDEFE